MKMGCEIYRMASLFLLRITVEKLGGKKERKSSNMYAFAVICLVKLDA